MKRDFKIGDRVRVLGAALSAQDGGYREATGIKGNVSRLGEFDATIETTEDKFVCHQRQLVRLKPPKPKPEKKEARRVWIYQSCFSDELVKLGAFHCLAENPQVFTWRDKNIIGAKKEEPLTEFREVLPHEAVVTRETLREVCVKLEVERMSNGWVTWHKLATALNLPEVKP